MDITKYDLGEVTKNLIEHDDFDIIVNHETKTSFKNGTLRNIYDVTLVNQKGRRFTTSRTTTNNIQNALNTLEKYAREELNEEYDNNFPLDVMIKKISWLTKTKFYNSDAPHHSRNATYNGYDVMFSQYHESGLPKIEIWKHNAGNTILEFCPLTKNTVLNNQGSIHINPNNLFMNMEGTIGELIVIVGDYLQNDIDVRIKEWNNRFNSDWTLESLKEIMN